MNVAELVSELRADGLELWEDSGRLRFRGPQGAMTPQRREALQSGRDAVLAYLRGGAGAVTVQPDPSSRFEPFPLTDVQAAYLLGRRDVFAYGGVACHAYGELVFDDVDPDRMQAAWNALVRRHDMLRAVIDVDGYQRVLPTVPEYRIEVTDARGTGTQEAAAARTGVRAGMDHEVLDPAQWPLFGLRLTRSDESAVLHVSIDFLIADYVSIYVLLDELHELYADPQATLPEPGLEFRDYLMAERRLRNTPRYERDRAYWTARVDDLPPAPELPLAGGPGEAERTFSRVEAVLDAPTWAAIRAEAARRGVTASGAVLAAYAETIGRWSRQPRFTLDLTLLSRLPLHPDVGRVVGDFTSVELLAVDQREAGTLAGRAVALGGRLFEDLDHRLFTGVEVLREIARRRGQEAALMPVVFTSAIGLRQDGATEAPLGELGEGISQTPQVWVDCQVMEHGDRLAVNWDFRLGVFPDGLVADMFAAFTALLRRMAEPSTWDEARPVPLPAGQRERRTAVNAVSGPRPDRLLAADLLAAAAAHPDRPALVAGERTCSYVELTGRAAAIAIALREAGSTPGSLVAVVLDKGVDQIAAVLGVLLAGSAYLPIDTHQPPLRRERILRGAGVRHVVQRAGDEVPDGIAAVPVDGLEQRPAEEVARLATELTAKPDDLAYVIYTSGSTGEPKGVMITHRAALNTIDDITRRFAVSQRDRVLGLANLGFDLSVYDVFGVLGAGGVLVLTEAEHRADPSHWAALVARHGVTLWNSVPAQLHMLSEYLRGAPAEELPALRLALLSGDWIPVSLPDAIRSRLPGLRVISLGGATEASIWSIFHPIDAVDPARPSIPYGTPLANQRFHVVDQLGQDAPDWVAGDLYIGGDGVALGYRNDAERTAERFGPLPTTGERSYRTGDVGRYWPDGTIEFLGRDDRQVKIRGYRIELAEIEAGLAADPQLGASAVLVTGETPLERRLVAVVEPARTGPAPLADPGALIAEVETAGAQVRQDGDVARVVEFSRQLDRTALGVMVDVLRRHGLFADQAQIHPLEEIFVGVRVADKHRRLLRRWLSALVNERYLALEDGRYRMLKVIEPADVAADWDRVRELLPQAQDRPELVHYFEIAAAHLPQLLRDEQDPVQLLFPEGRLDIQEAAYMEGFLSRYLNTLSKQTLRSIAARRRDGAGPMRVLEVGAGVGGTSVEVVPGLADLDVHYLFTDVSQFFLNKAAERFAEYPWMGYALYDMNEPYRAQGLEPNSLDVILVGNVMHYSRNADTVLAWMRELLVPGGWLVFLETTRDNYQILTSMEFLFDATNGDFSDVRQGQDQTFVRREQWLKLLDDAGAETVLCLPTPDDELAAIGMHVFAARFKNDRVPVDEQLLARRLGERVPAEMVPARVQVVDDLPLTENGKVDRRTLESWVSTGARTGGEAGRSDEPMTGLEQRISRIWCSVLRVPEVGRTDNFYALGGDSLLAAQVITEVREQVPGGDQAYFDELLRELLNTATVAGLAGLLGDTGAAADDGAAGARLLGEPSRQPVGVLVPGSAADGEPVGGAPDALADALARSHRVLALAPVPAVGEDDDPQLVLERTAGTALLDVRGLADGPYHVVGLGSGAVLALELAARLSEAGAPVAGLTVVDPGPPLVGDALVEPYAGSMTALTFEPEAPDSTLALWQEACLGGLDRRALPDGAAGPDDRAALAVLTTLISDVVAR